MTALARRAAIVTLIATLTACSGTVTKPETSKAPSDLPPPLVPAMALPDNAVDNAVAKLDGIADELMKSSGIPGMAVAVVRLTFIPSRVCSQVMKLDVRLSLTRLEMR